MDIFEELLQKELNKLPYTKHLDDGQYNDGQIVGFELGARWALSLFAVSGMLPYPIEVWDGVKVDIIFKGGRLVIKKAQ